MILSSIQLKNFRKHTDIFFHFSPGLNYITGGNGEGKTSVLESIYYLCTTKSHSTKSDMEVINFGKTDFEITGSFKDVINNKIRVYYSSIENKKYYFLNNKQAHRASEIIGKFPVVLLTPSDHSLTQGSPAERRKFVDSVICQASSTYLNMLIDYNKTLKQRSSLLLLIKENKTRSYLDELEAWTQKLVSSGIDLIKHRISFVKEFNEYVRQSYKTIMDEGEIPEIIYTSPNLNYREEIENQFMSVIKSKRDDEIRRAANLVGPHKDDFIFQINGLNLRIYGSQGQHKTFQVALRFAEFFYLKEITGKIPIFLLDDVFGELDTNRSVKISNYLKEIGQVFITLTDFTNLNFLKKGDGDFVFNLSRGESIYA